MEVKLDALIEKIKQEGVEAGQTQGHQIVAQAKQQAQKLKDQAQAESQKIREQARKEAEQFRHNAESALRQAARDIVLMVRGQLVGLSEQLLQKAVSAAFSPETMKELLVNIVQKWEPGSESSLEILISQKDKEKLEKLLFAALGDKARGSIEIKSSPLVQHGFRIGSRDDQSYYDFSDEGITEALKLLVTPKVAELLDRPPEKK